MTPVEHGPDATLRVAYTLEQCWHRVPGGTATAAIRVAHELLDDPTVRLAGVAAAHRGGPPAAWRPPIPVRHLPLPRPLLYRSWLRLGHPMVERATGPVDVCHATALIPPPTRAPLVVTVHDLAFRRWPERFTRNGVAVMDRALGEIVRRADVVLSPSAVTTADLVDAGIEPERIAAVPLGVDVVPAPADTVAHVRQRFDLPERFVLFVGTLEPRKNLRRLITAMRDVDAALVVVGATGWGDSGIDAADSSAVRFVGFVEHTDLAALYAAASVMAYPSEWEGFGLPVLEAMAQGTPVVTSQATATEEVAGGAAVLVDPLDTDSIAAGIAEALDPARAERLREAGRRRATEMTWSATTAATLGAYRLAIERAGPGTRRGERP